MGDDLGPMLRERVLRVVRPDFTRTVLARRLAAGVLTVLAAALALRPDPAGTFTDVAVAAADLSPGVSLTIDDVRLQKHAVATVPDGAITDLARLEGLTLAGPTRRGEVLTDARVLGSRLAGLTAGPDARVVPVHLADTAVLDVIRTGDVVDVLGAAQAGSDARPRLLAAGAIVVLVSAAAKTPGARADRVVLVALPRAAATAVAGASLTESITLTIH